MSDKKTNLNMAGKGLQFIIGRLRGPHLRWMSLAVVLMLVGGWVANQPALLLGTLVDGVMLGASSSKTSYMLLLIFTAILGRELLTWVRRFLVERAATALEATETTRLTSSLLSVDLLALEGYQTGALNSRFNRSLEGLVRGTRLLFMDFAPTLITAAVAVGLIARTSLIGLGFILTVLLLGSIVTVFQIQSQQGIRLQLFHAKDAINAKIVEILMSLDFVRAAAATRVEVNRTRDLAHNLQVKELTHHKAMMSFDSLKQLVEGGGLVATIAWGAYLQSIGSLSSGQVLSLAILYGAASTPIRDLHRILDEGFEDFMRIDDLRELYKLPKDPVLQTATALSLNSGGPAEITVENLRVSPFKRRSPLENHLLDDVNFVLHPEQTLGVVGPSGSGKSTLIKVLAGVLPYEGTVAISGHELADLSRESLAAKVGYVPQRPALFAGSLRLNLAYPSPQTFGDPEVWKALATVGLTTRFREHGLDSWIAEQGRNLSGGEQQRLAIARVLLKGPKILLLDEATAALDTIHERAVQEAIERASTGRTTVVVAHRLSTVRNATRILVLDEGRVAQIGTFKKLAAEEGLFKTLWTAQRL